MELEPEKESIVVTVPSIPWQQRERLGFFFAFWMTTVEIFTRPLEYFEKLQIKDDVYEPLILFSINFFFLTWPLLWHYSSIPYFLTFLAVLTVVFALLMLIPCLISRAAFGYWTRKGFLENIYILGYSSPVLILALLPFIGYWLAAIALTAITAIGILDIYQASLRKHIFAFALVPLLVFVPYGAIQWREQISQIQGFVDAEREAKSRLVVLTALLERYKVVHKGRYPDSEEELKLFARQYAPSVVCGQTREGYSFSCELRNYGYVLRARPEGWKNKAKKTFMVTTRGKIQEFENF